MATDEDYPIDLSILVIEAQIFVAVKKLPFLPNKLIPTVCIRDHVSRKHYLKAAALRWLQRCMMHTK